VTRLLLGDCLERMAEMEPDYIQICEARIAHAERTPRMEV